MGGSCRFRSPLTCSVRKWVVSFRRRTNDRERESRRENCRFRDLHSPRGCCEVLAFFLLSRSLGASSPFHDTLYFVLSSYACCAFPLMSLVLFRCRPSRCLSCSIARRFRTRLCPVFCEPRHGWFLKRSLSEMHRRDFFIPPPSRGVFARKYFCKD